MLQNLLRLYHYCREGTMRDAVAFKFTSSLTLEQMYKRLTELGPWHWYERDNDRWGCYISASPMSDTQIKILIDPDEGSFALNLKFVSEMPDAQQQFEKLSLDLLTRVLPAIDAIGPTPTETYE
jgi:hypothetical protein